MRTVPLPPIDAEEAYSAVFACRRPRIVRQRLQDAEPAVVDAYTEYDAETADVTGLAPCDTNPATADDLVGNYESKSAAAVGLRSAVLANNRGGKCALCGQVTAATLDHYLP